MFNSSKNTFELLEFAKQLEDSSNSKRSDHCDRLLLSAEARRNENQRPKHDNEVKYIPPALKVVYAKRYQF